MSAPNPHPTATLQSQEDDTRAPAELRFEVHVPFSGAAIGVATARLYESVDGPGDRDGSVLRLSIDNQGSCVMPTATPTPGGFDLHLPGTEESAAALDALIIAIRYAQQSRHRTGECP
jgi:hypothetical protein